MIDGLLLVRLVTADGDVMEASKTKNSDLFWGIRGAGFNFGIVVSATYKLHKPTGNGMVFSTDFLLPLDKKSDYFKLLQSLSQDGWPAELAILSAILYDPNSGSVSSISFHIPY